MILPFHILWVVTVFSGAVFQLGFFWLLADTLNALMAIPSLLGCDLVTPEKPNSPQ